MKKKGTYPNSNLGGGLSNNSCIEKKKAFTLIELLLVIVIIGVIALITTPIIMGTLKKSRKTSFTRSIDGLIESVRINHAEDKFIAPREYFYEQNNLTLLTVEEKTRDEDVKVNGRIDGKGFIYVDGEGNITIDNICNKEYCANGPEDDVVITENPSGNIPDINKNDPVITLNGNRIMYINLNERYVEMGAIARTKLGEPLEYTTSITVNDQVVSEVDVTTENTYKITYSATSNEKTVSVERTVIVLDMKPIITMTEPNENYVTEEDILVSVSAVRPNELKSFEIETIKDGVSINKETINDTVTELYLDETGIYEIVVSATDNNNHTNQMSKTYKIDHIGPVITFEEDPVIIKETEISGYDIYEGVYIEDNVEGEIEANYTNVRTEGELGDSIGSYEITYIVQDQAGNETSKTRRFEVVEGEGPKLNFSSISTGEKWVQELNVTLYANDPSGIKSFQYEIYKDGVSKGIVPIEQEEISLESNVLLNETGRYTIKLKAKDIYENESEIESGIYQIDVTPPVLTVKSEAIEKVNKGNNIEISSYFNEPIYSLSGGSISCSPANTNGLELGEQIVTCTVTGGSGLQVSATKKLEIFETNVWVRADTSNHGTSGNVPTLSNGLIAVKYKTEVDETTKWYDYDKQMWANAVAVKEEYRNVPIGTSIPEDAVLAYFVWIPRYEYDYTNLGDQYAGGTKEEPGEIKVNFIAKTKTTPSSNNYKVHPAFTFGDQELSGIWVGKFETTGDITTPTIKPNLGSLYSHEINIQFTTAQKFSASGNSYGIVTSADSHMMKNSEWGAVAYLTQSKYGKYGNANYIGANKEVYINNNTHFRITGCSAGSPSASSNATCEYTYEKENTGTGASTTGTIYGVYDMNGCVGEHVMGNYNEIIGKAGFSKLPQEKYYDKYTSTTSNQACNNGICYGHALSETEKWYNDYNYFIGSSYPWFLRGEGGEHGTGAGIFTFSNYSGGSHGNTAFRVVLLD